LKFAELFDDRLSIGAFSTDDVKARAR
jgi:hypothetical protein